MVACLDNHQGFRVAYLGWPAVSLAEGPACHDNALVFKGVMRMIGMTSKIIGIWSR